jgi:hypothetical protein
MMMVRGPGFGSGLFFLREGRRMGREAGFFNVLLAVRLPRLARGLD